MLVDRTFCNRRSIPASVDSYCIVAHHRITPVTVCIQSSCVLIVHPSVHRQTLLRSSTAIPQSSHGTSGFVTGKVSQQGGEESSPTDPKEISPPPPHLTVDVLADASVEIDVVADVSDGVRFSSVRSKFVIEDRIAVHLREPSIFIAKLLHEILCALLFLDHPAVLLLLLLLVVRLIAFLYYLIY